MSTYSLDFSSFHNVIDGQLKDTEKTTHNLNPSTLAPNPEVPVSSLEDVNHAVKVAQRAAASWASVPLEDRQNAVKRYADAVESLKEEFAIMLVKEQGKSIHVARREILAGIQTLRDMADLPFNEEVNTEPSGRRVIVRHVPIGVSVGIVPWNFPISIACFKIAPALITGNAMIIKPSPFTPYCNLKLAELGQQIFPPGVLQALSGGDDLGPWLTSHPDVGKVSFTGSVATGKRVMESCSKTLKRVTLELGGNDPAIVCPDVDLAAVVPQIAMFALLNSGQTCIAIKRIYVHASIYDDFLPALAAAVHNITLGDGLDEKTLIGPVQNPLQYDRIKDLLANVKETALKVANPETAEADLPGKGYFIQPTIVDNPPDESRIVQEEPFGPVFPVLKWTDENDVIRRANDADVGLGASVWTTDMKRAERIARRIQSGTVWINTHAVLDGKYPFAGHKTSGIGLELGVEGLKSFCNVQTLYLG